MQNICTTAYYPQNWGGYTNYPGTWDKGNVVSSTRSTAELMEKSKETESVPIGGSQRIQGVKDKILRFKTPYNLTIRREDGFYTSESEVFKTYNAGKTKQELVSDFIEDLYLAWQIYVDCSEQELTEKAKVLRNNLQEWLEINEL